MNLYCHRYVFLTAFFLMHMSSYGQFFKWEKELYFTLKDKNHKLIGGAEVYIDGHKLEQLDSCPSGVGSPCYVTPKFYMLQRVHLTVKHPDYLPIDDTVNTLVSVYLFTKQDTTYYYCLVKVPCEMQPDTYCAAFYNYDSLKFYKNAVQSVGGTILSSFSTCGPNSKGPEGFTYYLPQSSEAKELQLYLTENFQSGLLVKPHPAHPPTSFINSFTVSSTERNKAKAIEYLEKLKAESVIEAYYPSVDYGLYKFLIRTPKGEENKIISIIDEMVKTRVFTDPLMSYHVYKCLH